MNFLKKEMQDFLVVSQYLNISKAADFLGMKQAGLSKSIQRLEMELGHKLFIRQARGLVLTEVGKIYRQKIEQMNIQWQDAHHEMEDLFSKSIGTFTISFHPIVAKYILPKLLLALKPHPHILINCDFVSSREAVQKVLSSQVDLAIAMEPIKYPELVIKKLWKEFTALYSNDGKIKDTVCFNAEMIYAYKNLANFKNIKHQVINNYDVIYSIIKRDSNMMGLLPNHLAEKEDRLKLVKKFTPLSEATLVYRGDKQKTKAFQLLLDTIVGLKFVN